MAAPASVRAFFNDIHATPYDVFTSSPLLMSFAGLVLSFFLASPRYSTMKQTSWIVTAIASFVMSIASLPFLWDYFLGGGSVKHIRALPVFAISVNRFFQSYLAADLILGTIYYRSRISFVEGWIHHITYIMVVELAIRRSWSHIFCLCASMEIPTFILGFTTLYPQLRHNTLFACSFFAFRIVFHILLTFSYFSAEARAYATGGSFIPAILIASAFPLHVVWFVGCIKGFIRRAAEAHLAQAPPIIGFDIIPGATAPVKHNASVRTSGPPKPSPSVYPHTWNVRLSHRRRSLESIFQTLRLDVSDLKSGELGLWSARATLPRRQRQVIYESVGLGRAPGALGRGVQKGLTVNSSD